MTDYLLGIDNGLTVSKVAIFDLDGREVQVASRKRDTVYLHPGWTESDMEAVWQCTVEAIRNAIHQSGIRPAQIVGIGNTGHGNGIYLLDRHGRPVRAGILSLDTRAGDIVNVWNARGIGRQFWTDVLQFPWPGAPVALFRWLKFNEPETYEQIATAFFCKDYVKYRLTGTLTTDFTDTSVGGLMDVRHKRYALDALELLEIGEMRDRLPAAAESAEIVGNVTAEVANLTGLKAGTPVIGGMIDVCASAVGSGVIEPGQVCVVAGTWSINELVTAQPMIDSSLFMVANYVPDRWITIEASATSATNLEWFVNQFCAEELAEARRRNVSVYELCNEQVASLPPGGTDILFHPFLFGSNVQSTARAGFYGIAGWHTKAHLLRAVYEGVAYSHLSHLEKLRAAGAPMNVVRLSGGGARSQVWAQIFADTFQLPIEVPQGSEIGARGAALVAGIGVGIYNDYADAVRKAVQIARRHEPDTNATPHYLARYAEYQNLLQAMQESWDRLSKLSRRASAK
jgi:L-xylulokinase